MDAPSLPQVVYISEDGATADIYLTDLSADDLDPGRSLAELDGRIVHLHLFIVPLAGSTPIEDSACSVTVRHIVLARGKIGVYSGGGFLFPTRSTDNEFSARMSGATLRLTAETPGFSDRLGACTLDTSFRARRDESMATRIGQRVNEILLVVRPVPGAAPATAPAAGPGGGAAGKTPKAAGK